MVIDRDTHARRALATTSSLELAAGYREDVDQARIRPVRGDVTMVIAEFRLKRGTVNKVIETRLHKLCDGRTMREILDDWLGPEPEGHRSRKSMLDATPMP